MKKLILIFISFLATSIVNATDQVPDFLFYNNEKLTIDIGWGHPSPLETYFRQNNLEYPFEMISTANYRGHIATWKIDDGKFFLTEISVRDKKYNPKQFNIESQNTDFSSQEKVFADWFTGVLVSQKRDEKNYWQSEYSIHIYVRNGIVQKSEKMTQKEFERLRNLSEKDKSNPELMRKYGMLYLNQSYIAYYFRLHDQESITIENKTGFIKGKNGNSIVLEYFNNSHLDWPYNWENFEISGAPNGNWEIIDNKLFLSSLNLNTGLSFDGPESIPIELSSVFQIELINNKLLANWTNGIYIIIHGEEIADDLMPDFKIFKEKEYTLLRIKEGVVIEKYTIPREFDIQNVPDNADQDLKVLIEDLKSQSN